jgi:hypothetical protein
VRTTETPNDEVERRGASPASNEGTLSQSSTYSFAQRRRDPRSLEPIVMRYLRGLEEARLLYRNACSVNFLARSLWLHRWIARIPRGCEAHHDVTLPL